MLLAAGGGAALGALLRGLVGVATVASLGLPAFAATGFVNLLGSFAIGFIATASAPGGRLPLGPTRRLFLMTGLCGGFTTFSSMSLDAFLMLAERRVVAGLAYLAVVVLVSVAACWIGHLLAARINR